MTPSTPASGSILLAAQAIKAERDAALNRCPISRILGAMEPTQAAELQTLLRMDKAQMPSAVIVAVLAPLGYAIDDSPIQAHRRSLKGGSGCKCPSSTTPSA